MFLMIDAIYFDLEVELQRSTMMSVVARRTLMGISSSEDRLDLGYASYTCSFIAIYKKIIMRRLFLQVTHRLYRRQYSLAG